MAVMLFGQRLAKSVGTRRPGAQAQQLTPAQQVLATAISSVSRQTSMNQQPDPTLGAPFSSFPSNRLTVAQMGPGEPAENFPLGAEPRQWKYRVGWNFPTTPDTDKGINHELLRTIADSVWLFRRAIEIRKAELCGLEWEIVGAGRTGRERKENSQRHEALIRYLSDFFRYPEGYFSFTTPDDQWWARHRQGVERREWVRRGLVDWQDWFNALLEDYFVGDWTCVWPQRTLGGEMLGLRRVDGAHIKALLDLDGRMPPPPMPAWQQYLYGVPRASWAANELYYWPRVVRNMTPYGYSHVQQGLIVANLLLRFDQWNTAAYTENRVPMGILETPPGLTPDQIQDIADFLNGAVNSLAARQMVHPVPAGTKWQPIKPFIFEREYAYYIIEVGCSIFDVMPVELGFAPNTKAGLGGKGFSETQMDARRRKTLVPTARWWERKFTRAIQEQWRGQGGECLEFRFKDLAPENEAEQYAAKALGIKSGLVDLDQLAEEQGEKAPGIGRILEVGNGVLFVDQGWALVGGQRVPLEPPDPNAPAPSIFPMPSGPPEPSPPKAPGGGAPTPPTTKAPMSMMTTATNSRDEETERRKLEEAFLAAWLAWWRRHVETALAQPVTVAEQAKARFLLDDAARLALSRLLDDTLRHPLYAQTFARLREAAGLPEGPSTTPTRADWLREETRSQTHLVQVAQTFATALEDAYQTLLRETEGVLDPVGRAEVIHDRLGDWVRRWADWKGRQIAVTEATDVMSLAQRDFSVQNPAVLFQWRWRAQMDDRTCDVCAGLDGQVFDLNAPFPPAHPNCRCWAQPAVQQRGGPARSDGTSFAGYGPPERR